MKLVARVLTVIGLALVPLLFNNCGSSFVVNADGSVAASTFPNQYTRYGDYPSQKANILPSANTRFPIQAIKPGSGLTPTVTN